MKKSSPAVVILLATIGVVFAVVGSAAAQAAKTQAAKASAAKASTAEPHPHIYNAYRLLKRAHYVLQHACRNLSGDRAGRSQPSGLGDQRTAARNCRGPRDCTSSRRVRSYKYNTRPTSSLRPRCPAPMPRGQTELAAAAQDFGGHRTNAVQHVDAAIAQLEQAVKYPLAD